MVKKLQVSRLIRDSLNYSIDVIKKTNSKMKK